MNPSVTKEFDRRNRNSSGKLYMPSAKFGLELKDANSDVTHGGGGKSKQQSMESAQQWVLGEKGRSATVYRRCDPACKPLIHYWNDGKMQFIRYED